MRRRHLEVSSRSYFDCGAGSAFKPPRVLLVVGEPRSASALFGPNTINLSAGQNTHALHSRVIKRTIDLMIGIPSFLIALPVIGVLALAIKFWIRDLRSTRRCASAFVNVHSRS